MSTGRKRSLSGPACSSPTKRKKYLCKYLKAWETEFSWLSHSDRSVNDAYCILCKSHLSIGSGAKNDKACKVTKPYAAGDGSKEIKINVFVCNNAKQFFEE